MGGPKLWRNRWRRWQWEVAHLAEMVEAQGVQLQELRSESGGTGGRRQGAGRRER